MRGGVIFWLIVALGFTLGTVAYLLQLPPAPLVPVAVAMPAAVRCLDVVPTPDFCDQFQQPSQYTKCKARVRV